MKTTQLRRLINGTQVPSDHEAWRHECEARMVCGLPNQIERSQYLAEVERRRGPEAATALRETMALIWQSRNLTTEPA